MFYGALVLSKKGPLAKVWLAAHWDKKLTKAHVFETDVEHTVEKIMSPQVKLALRTSGHLLLGVVRIYSRKQKYLLHDLGEACAKIKMAFRPGIVDLPADSGADNADAITLPEIFHDFETAVADLGALDLQAQFTINPNRASDITIPEAPSNTGTGDIFGGGFGDFGADDFEGRMEDIPSEGQAPTTTAPSAKEAKEPAPETITTLEEEKAHDAVNDFGENLLEDGFGNGDGGEFGEFMDLNLDINKPSADVSGIPAEVSEEIPMEVDPPNTSEEPKVPEEPQRPAEEEAPPPPLPSVPEEDPVVVPTDIAVTPTEEEGFVLDPVDMTGMEEKRVKRKRRLVVDTDKEFTGQQIKSQFDDFKDLLQPKCFPPPTKKAMMWKEMAGCDQLYSHPTVPGLDQELRALLTRNYNVDIPGEPSKEAFELDNISADLTKDSILSEDTSIEKQRTSQVQAPVTSKLNITPPDASTDNLVDPHAGIEEQDSVRATDQSHKDGGILQGKVQDESSDVGVSGLGLGLGELAAPGDMEFPDMIGVGDMGGLGDLGGVGDIGGELDDAQGQSIEQQSNELSEEFEQRRWTKRTQQVLHVLQRNLGNTDEVFFSALTQKCNRKQAASRFYTCLLLAKEGMISIHQPEPYADIQLTRGPKYTEV